MVTDASCAPFCNDLIAGAVRMHGAGVEKDDDENKEACLMKADMRFHI